MKTFLGNDLSVIYVQRHGIFSFTCNQKRYFVPWCCLRNGSSLCAWPQTLYSLSKSRIPASAMCAVTEEQNASNMHHICRQQLSKTRTGQTVSQKSKSPSTFKWCQNHHDKCGFARQLWPKEIRPNAAARSGRFLSFSWFSTESVSHSLPTQPLPFNLVWLRL